MTQDRIIKAIARATRDLHHARAMGALAFGEAARKRHARRERVAANRIREAKRALAMGGLLDA